MEDCYLLELIREMSANEKAEGDGRGSCSLLPGLLPEGPQLQDFGDWKIESCGNPDSGWSARQRDPAHLCSSFLWPSPLTQTGTISCLDFSTPGEYPRITQPP